MRRLQFRSSHLGDPALQALSEAHFLTTLRELHLRLAPHSPQVLGELLSRPELAGLEALRLDALPVPSGDVTELARSRLPRLHTLNLTGNQIDAPTCSALIRSEGFPKLKSLVFTSSVSPASVTAREFAAGNRHELTELFWDYSGLLDDGVRALSDCPALHSLRVLSLVYNGITSLGVGHLANSPTFENLRWLNLAAHIFPEEALRWIFDGRWRKLALLNVARGRARASPDELRPIIASLDLPELRDLNLSGWPIGARGAKELSRRDCLRGLRALHLRNCEIRDTGAAALVESPTLEALELLDLRGNPITKGLPERPGLRVLADL